MSSTMVNHGMAAHASEDPDKKAWLQTAKSKI